MFEGIWEKIKEFIDLPADFGVLPDRLVGLPVEAAGAVTQVVAPQLRAPLRRALNELTRDLDELDWIEEHFGLA